MRINFLSLVVIITIAFSAITYGQDVQDIEKINEIKRKQTLLVLKGLPEADTLISEIERLPLSGTKFSLKLTLAKTVRTYNLAKSQNMLLEVMHDFYEYADQQIQMSDQELTDFDANSLLSLQSTIYTALRELAPTLAVEFQQNCKKIKEFSSIEFDNITTNSESAPVPGGTLSSEIPADKLEILSNFDRLLSEGKADTDTLKLLKDGMGIDNDLNRQRVINFTEKFLENNHSIDKENIASLFDLMITGKVLMSEAKTSDSSSKSNNATVLFPENLSNRLITKILSEWLLPKLGDKGNIEYQLAFQTLSELLSENSQYGILLTNEQTNQLQKKLFSIDPTSEARFKLKTLRINGSSEAVYLETSKSTEEFRSDYLELAMQKALEEGNYSLYDRIAKENKLNPRLSNANYQMNVVLEKFISNNQVDKAMNLLTQVKHRSQRIESLVQVADAFIEKNRPTASVKLLIEAFSISQKLPSNSNKTKAIISIANSYLDINTSKSIELIESIFLHDKKQVKAFYGIV